MGLCLSRDRAASTAAAGAGGEESEGTNGVGSSSDSIAPCYAQCLYADALVSVLSFLPLRDVAAAARSCRHWCSHAAKEPSRGLSLDIQRGRPLLSALLEPFDARSPRDSTLAERPALAQHSAIGQHVTTCDVLLLGLLFGANGDSEGELRRQQLTVAPLLRALGRFPELQRLTVQPPQVPHTESDGRVQFPLTYDLSPLLALEKLHTMELEGVAFTAPQRLPPSLRHLKFGLLSPPPSSCLIVHATERA